MEEELELPPDNDYFYESIVEVAMGIIEDCKKIVETVNGINTEDETNNEAMKDAFVEAAKRVPQTSAKLTVMVHTFVNENKGFYLNDRDYLDLFEDLRTSAKAVKDSVFPLVRLATVSVWRIKSAATTSRTQQLLETHCKEVALAIKKVIDASEELKIMEEEEEEGWIEAEAEELSKAIQVKTVTLAKVGSTAVKDLVTAAIQPGGDETAFVQIAKNAWNALKQLLDFSHALRIKEEENLKEATYNLLSAAKESFQLSGAAAARQKVESARDRVAQVLHDLVLSARSTNTEEIVRARLLADEEPDTSQPQSPPSAKPASPSLSRRAQAQQGLAPTLGNARPASTTNLPTQRPLSLSSSTGSRIGSMRVFASSPSLGSRPQPPAPPSQLQKPLSLSNSSNGIPTVTAVSAPSPNDEQTIAIGTLRKGTLRNKQKLTTQQMEQLHELKQHLQHQGPLNSGHTMRRRVMQATQPRAQKSVDLSRYANDTSKIVILQRHIRSWLRVQKFRNLALDFLIAPESERLRKRSMALWEIVSTERSYVANLEDLERAIISPLRGSSHSFITEREITQLFSNLESIIGLNTQILEAMEERMDAWPSDCRFADIFIQKAPVLRLYTEYLNNYERQVQVLTELEKKPAFVAFLKGVKSKMSLANYLILPVQRLPRYEILLESLLKYTCQEHVDYGNIIAALDKVKELNLHVDKKKKDEDNRRSIQSIQKSISGIGALYVAHRRFIREGVAEVLFPNRKKEDREYLYLFSDMLVITRMKTKAKGGTFMEARPKTKYKESLRFKDGYKLEPSSESNSFKLAKAGQPHSAFTFFLPTESNRNKWVQDIEAVEKEEGWKKILYD
ncbi:Rho guanine nucleotide exchange factor (GEF) 17 [Balamuthia mandrillaris]